LLKTTRKNKNDYSKIKLGLSNEHKGNEPRLWDGKKITFKYSLLKKMFKDNNYSLRLFLSQRLKNKQFISFSSPHF